MPKHSALGRPSSTSSRSFTKSLFVRIIQLVGCFALVLHLYILGFVVTDSRGDPTTIQQHDKPSISRRTRQQQNNNATATIAYAISLIKCGDHQSNDAGLVDAALVMRHSIHLTSIRNPSSGSRYDYKMYALVHKQAVQCSSVLKNAGFQVVVIEESPVKPSDIRGEYLRNNIELEWCCGSDEFIKLYATTLPEPVVVHTDIDFVFLKPMDHLFDAILFPKDSPQGQAARASIQLERPEEADSLPDKIDAFITRDWPQVIPGRKALYQAGFVVAGHNPDLLQEAIDIVKEGDFKEGYELRNGWSSAGYGGFVGAMAMQGLMAYYYDIVRPNTAVELNQCRFNHMGMDVRYRHPPNFYSRKKKKVGRCRTNRDECEDCMTTNVNLIYNVHFTQCRKPWNCIGIGHAGGRIPGGPPATAIDTDAGNFDHCMELVEKWHSLRSDLEKAMYALTKDKTVMRGVLGLHKREIFHGHCTGEGGSNYTQIQARPGTFERMEELYR